MKYKESKTKLIAWLIVLSLILLIIGFLWSKRTVLRYAFENYRMGTYQKNLSEEELIRKRTLRIGHLQFVVPARWTIMKDFPRKGQVAFDLDLPDADGSIDVFVKNGKTNDEFNTVYQKEALSQINNYMSNISTLANKDARTDAISKSINGVEWRVIQTIDQVSIGKRHTGIYYTVVNGDLIGLYFFSIGDSSAPIMHAVEELISRFHL